jgi:hypothetical protein
MSSLFPSRQADAPYARAPAKGQAIAASILAAGAIAAIVWAGHGAAAPAPRVARVCDHRLTQDQSEAASLRIRYADAAVTSDDAEKAVRAAWRNPARLCGAAA